MKKIQKEVFFSIENILGGNKAVKIPNHAHEKVFKRSARQRGQNVIPLKSTTCNKLQKISRNNL